MFSYRWQQWTMVCVVVLSLALGACSDNKKKPTEPDPEPDVPRVTQTFRGGVNQNTTVCNSFSMQNGGSVQIELVELQPLRTITMGMGIGTPDNSLASRCAMFAQDDSVRIFQVFASSGLAPGNYCTCVYDVGNIFPGETVSFAQEVVHPE